MEGVLIGLVGGIIIGGVFVWGRKKGVSGEENQAIGALKEQVHQKDIEIERIQKELDVVKSKRDKFEGENKQLFTENNNQKTDLRILREENKKQNELIVEFKGEKSRKEKEFGQLVDKLTRAEEKFTKEQGRVEEEERERKDKEKKEWDRVWNEHEIESISRMKGVCRKPEIDFIFYDNENLPDGFSGRFKPDFLVKFLEHYVIFDAKFNKPESNTSLQEYLKKTAKGTAKKIKESGVSDEIYKTVFFVVPSVAVGTLQQVSFFEDGISFHAISIEAVEPILSAFKKVTYYKNIEAIDPQERENIISVFAAYDQQITLQNAFNILGAGRGEMVLEEAKKNLSSEMKEKIETKKGQIRIDNFKPIDLKRLVGSVDERKDGIKKMVISKSPLIKDTDIKEAQESLL